MATTCFHKWREDEVHSPWQLLEVEGTEARKLQRLQRAVQGCGAAARGESRHRLGPGQHRPARTLLCVLCTSPPCLLAIPCPLLNRLFLQTAAG